MVRSAVWNGSQEDLRRLLDAVEHWCECPLGDSVPDHSCAAHKMLHDQAALDHLVFAALRRQKYADAEFDPRAEWWS
jgi:hypothetical protein